MKTRFILTLLICLGCLLEANGAEPLKVSFRSRALLDATLSDYGKDDWQGYYRLEDFRLGFKAVMGRCELRSDISFAAGKVSIKDLLFNYRFGHNVLSVGNGYEPYSMDMLISTVDMRFLQSASSCLAFANSRKLGVTLHHATTHWYAATGLFSYNDINKLGKDDRTNAFISTSRLVWRPVNREGCLLHVGGAFSFRSKEANVPEEELSVRTVESSGVTALFDEPLLGTEVTGVGTEVKGLVEFLAAFPRFMIQGEYYLNRFNRDEGEAYCPQGGYVQAGILLLGRGFDYDSMYAVPGCPSTDKAVELTLRYNYTNLNDRGAQLSGGKESDLSVGVNYYLNRHFGLKLDLHYVFVGDGCNAFYTKDCCMGQMRVQYVF